MSEINSRRTPEAQDQINLFDVLIIILKYKWLIIAMAVLSIIISILFTYKSDDKDKQTKAAPPVKSSAVPAVDVYYSKCVVEVKKIIAGNVEALLMSRRIAEPVMKEANLETIFYKVWDNKTQYDVQSMEGSQIKAIQDLLVKGGNPDVIRPTLTIKRMDNLLELEFFSKEADVPQKILNAFLNHLSDYFRTQSMKSINLNKAANKRMLGSEKDPVLKEKIYLDLISLNKEEEKATASQVYGIDIIDPPTDASKVELRKAFIPVPVPAEPAPLLSAEAQRRMKERKIVIPVIIVSIFLAVMLAFFIEYLKNMKMNNPEKFQVLKDYARFRNK